MDSALCLHYVPMPSLQVHRIPSMVSTTRPHFTFSHSSRMLSNASTTHLKRHAFSPIIKHKAPSVRASGDDQAKLPGGGKTPLESLLDMISSDFPKESTLNLPPQPSAHDVDTLKKNAIGLLRSGKSCKAEELLQKPLQELLKEPLQKTEEICNLSMALAEIYIFQRKYDDALGCKCFEPSYSPPTSDGRIRLYRAIIFSTRSDKKEEAKTWWNQYVDPDEGGIPDIDPTKSDS